MINLASWVEEETDPARRSFRSAAQLVIRAIAQSTTLSPVMVMKGGTLMAIRYGSSRFTRDIDFSTTRKIENVDIEELLRDFSLAIETISADNEHGLALRLQSHVMQPSNNPKPTFPTLRIKIGYASRTSPRQLKRLSENGAADVVLVDYSFNEWDFSANIEEVDGGSISTYSFHDLIAEKLRSILQQPIRKRERFQDIYDVTLLLRCNTEITQEDRARVLENLEKSVEGRSVPLERFAMRDPEIERLSKIGYEKHLPDQITGDLPPFHEAFAIVVEFFESLPWKD